MILELMRETVKTTDNPYVLWCLRRPKELRCGYCRPHRSENARRKPKEDRHKDINRTTIRRLTLIA